MRRGPALWCLALLLGCTDPVPDGLYGCVIGGPAEACPPGTSCSEQDETGPRCWRAEGMVVLPTELTIVLLTPNGSTEEPLAGGAVDVRDAMGRALPAMETAAVGEFEVVGIDWMQAPLTITAYAPGLHIETRIGSNPQALGVSGARLRLVLEEAPRETATRTFILTGLNPDDRVRVSHTVQAPEYDGLYTGPIELEIPCYSDTTSFDTMFVVSRSGALTGVGRSGALGSCSPSGATLSIDPPTSPQRVFGTVTRPAWASGYALDVMVSDRDGLARNTFAAITDPPTATGYSVTGDAFIQAGFGETFLIRLATGDGASFTRALRGTTVFDSTEPRTDELLDALEPPTITGVSDLASPITWDRNAPASYLTILRLETSDGVPVWDVVVSSATSPITLPALPAEASDILGPGPFTLRVALCDDSDRGRQGLLCSQVSISAPRTIE